MALDAHGLPLGMIPPGMDYDDFMEMMDDMGPEYRAAPRLSINDLGEFNEHDLINEIPKVDLFHFPKAVLKEKKDKKLQASATPPQTSCLLAIPAEIQVSIFKSIPKYFRPQLARTCKALAKFAVTHELLSCNPTRYKLLAKVLLPLFEEGTAITKDQFPLYEKALQTSICAWCGWTGAPATPKWFRHVHMEASRLGIHLTAGMLKELAYESIYKQVVTPAFGRPDPSDWFMDDRFLDEYDDIEDELISPIKEQMKMLDKYATSKAEEGKKKAAQSKKAGKKQKK